MSGSNTPTAMSGGPVRRPMLHAVLVSTRQRGNPILQFIRSVPWEYADIPADYQVGATTGVLYLSIRYHRLHPEYVHSRIQLLGQTYLLRILLVQCDVDDHQDAIRELTKITLVNDLTIMMSWSHEQSGRYLETYKSFERKPPDLIKERLDDDHLSRLTAALTSVRGINRTDVHTLLTNFGSFEAIVKASPDQLTACPGLGEKKVRRLKDALQDPLQLSIINAAKKPQQQKPQQKEQSSTNEQGEEEDDPFDLDI